MRKEITWLVDDDNRDKGKEFVITEMSAWDAEELAEEIMRSMSHGGYFDIQPEVIQMGIAGLATIGLSVIASADRETARMIGQRLLDSVEIVITHEGKQTRRKAKSIDFEEVSTIRQIKDKAMHLNFDFLAIAAG
ncbi:TPA: hypothetical protein M4731_004640 [Salmonella enterica]|nr:hypothetical protein [Salmonella enterica]MCH5744718.1 hypothetical protein [Salmonella enterica]MCH5749677.1 hypothetical protein [Salmonella enterica]MCH5757169.1 hypothetical protein [Salmonella enterica]MCH5770144.1 hypothetical protein [Salmonella enterica]